MEYSKIIGTGAYLPERIVKNCEFEDKIETSDEWIRTRTGIAQRHIAADNQSTCDLAEQAVLRAIESAEIAPEQIDMIIVATTTPDLIFPGTACLLQKRLGIHGCPAFDVQAVCAGFIYAITIADKFIRTGSVKHILVVGAETMSHIIDWEDRSTSVLFGDGAGAVIIGADKEAGIIDSQLHSEGQHHALLQVPTGVGQALNTKDKPYMIMQGNEVFKVAVEKLGSVAESILTANQLKKDDVDWLIPHQANIRIIKAMAKRLGLPLERVVITIEQHGNTSAASVPIALDVAIRDGRIKRGHKLLLEAFGGGFTWGATLIKY